MAVILINIINVKVALSVCRSMALSPQNYSTDLNKIWYTDRLETRLV